MSNTNKWKVGTNDHGQAVVTDGKVFVRFEGLTKQRFLDKKEHMNLNALRSHTVLLLDEENVTDWEYMYEF